MKSQMKRSTLRTNDTRKMIFCCHGAIYTVTEKVLGADVDSADGILGRLRQIDGVKVVEVRGGVGNLMFPTLRLPEVARVLVPLDSVRAPRAFAVAAQRGRIW